MEHIHVGICEQAGETGETGACIGGRRSMFTCYVVAMRRKLRTNLIYCRTERLQQEIVSVSSNDLWI
jgi:hypothetical protein